MYLLDEERISTFYEGLMIKQQQVELGEVYFNDIFRIVHLMQFKFNLIEVIS